jgi:hypothetical protein
VDIEPLRVVAFSPRHECGVEGGGWLRYGSSRNPLSQAAFCAFVRTTNAGGSSGAIMWLSGRSTYPDKHPVADRVPFGQPLSIFEPVLVP